MVGSKGLFQFLVSQGLLQMVGPKVGSPVLVPWLGVKSGYQGEGPRPCLNLWFSGVAPRLGDKMEFQGAGKTAHLLTNLMFEEFNCVLH